MEEIKKMLPEREQGMFDDIVLQRVLGASTHIRMIGEMFLALASQAQEQQIPSKELQRNLSQIADFFKKTRGEASRAVTNAINCMVNHMGNLEECTVTEAARQVRVAVDDYKLQSQKDTQDVVRYAVGAAKEMKRIMVFDYSSTVNDFLRQLGKETSGIEVFIPESRTINGGCAFVSTALGAGMQVHFIPDAAIMYFLKKCDGAFLGAETLYADGTVFNTTGSDIVGLVCKSFRIPLYVLTPMVKLDMRPVYGYCRNLVVNDLKERMACIGFSEQELEQVNFKCPELLPISGEYITGVITEYGIVPAAAVYSLAVEYDKHTEKG